MDFFKINIEPSNRLFRELGNNNYDFVELISELIDNSLAARKTGTIVNIDIIIGYSKESNEPDYLIIKDDAKGISRNILPKAISPAALSGGTTLNEHGLGLKQAIAALGQLAYLKTKTYDIDYEMYIEELKFGEIEVKTNSKVNYESGTEIKINNLPAIVPIASQSYTQNIVPKLGAKYRKFLKPNNRKANIKIYLKNIDKNQEGEYIDKESSNWTIKEIKPIFFHRNKRINEPMIINKRFIGRDWEAYLIFGYAPNSIEYEELGLEKPKRYEPYNVSLNKQGLDIIRNDRIINFHQLFEIGLVNMTHNKYNYIRGEIHLIKGFTTAITKNNIINDQSFIELMNQIKSFLNSENLLEGKTYQDKLPEILLQNRLKIFLETNKVPALRKKRVQTEYAIEGLGGYVDVLADEEPWEIKNGQANGVEIYQLFAYMDMGHFKEGNFLAKEFTTGAESAKNRINKKYNKKINLIPLSDFPINHSPSPEELDKYF